MPSSFVDSVPGVMHCVIAAQPTSVVDIGPGWGKYGLMCREYLPDLQTLDAVEVCEGRDHFGVRGNLQDEIYDHILERDCRKVTAQHWAQYDVALLIDVIEHMPIAHGRDLLRTLLGVDLQVVVSTPKVFVEQHDDKNPYETHVSLWSWEIFQPFGILEDRSTTDSIIYRLGAS